MLNYIRAELYKALHRPYLWIMLGLLLAGEVLLLWIFYWSAGNNVRDFFSWVQLVGRMVHLGVFAAMLVTDMVFAGQHKNGTMKNEVSFGISRFTIYLGKLLAMGIVSVSIMLVAMAFYTGGCWLVADQTQGAVEAMKYLGLVLFTALPIWLGAQALNCALCFLLSSGVAAEMCTMALFIAASTVLSYLALLMSVGGNTVPLEIAGGIVPWLPDSVLNRAYTVTVLDWDELAILRVQWELVRDSWLVGAFWMAVSTALGLYGFHKKEIK